VYNATRDAQREPKIRLVLWGAPFDDGTL